MPSVRTKPAALPKSVACVHIDHLSLLLPTDKALALMKLLDDVVRVDRDFQRGGDLGWVYVVRGQPDIELSRVKPGQVVQPEPDQPVRQTVLQLK